MMILTNVNNDSSFNTNMRAGDEGKVFVETYATSGMVADTPYMVQWGGSGYNASILAASNYAYIGVHEDGKALASGCVGWTQIRGRVNNVQGSIANCSAEQGHGVAWVAAAFVASSSIVQGLYTVGQVGVFLEGSEATTANASTTMDVWLNGVWATPDS